MRTESPEPQPTKVVTRVFLRMGALFMHRFTSAFATEDALKVARAEWAHQLAGLSQDDLRRGFARLHERPAKDRSWPPGAIEFRELCLPSFIDFGMPEPEVAYHEATTREYSHPAVAWAASRANHALRFQDSREARRRFSQEYDRALDKARAGFEFPALPSRIGYEQPPAPPAERQRELAAEMRRRLSTERFDLAQEESHGST